MDLTLCFQGYNVRLLLPKNYLVKTFSLNRGHQPNSIEIISNGEAENLTGRVQHLLDGTSDVGCFT